MSLRRLFVFALLLNVVWVVSVMAQEEKPHWSYEAEGETSPSMWAQLSPDYALCGTGKTQSPIDIASTVATDVSDIAFNYASSALTIFNNGHTVQVNYDGGSEIVYNERAFSLAQFHVHHPSEHTLNGEAFPLEVHFVHKDADGNLAVVGVLVKEGAENPAYAEFLANLPTEEGEPTTLDYTVNALQMMPAEKTYYTYSGSLTTPPCSEGVRWLLLTTPIELSAEQIEAVGMLFEHNARPIQSLNARDVLQDTLTHP